MQIDRFIKFDDESFLQLVWHFVFQIFKQCFLIV
jgi:hypothetical protein